MNTGRQIVLPTGLLEIQAEDGEFSLDELVRFAARNNPKRGFLFVSTVLGKHWPAQPAAMRRAHDALAARLPTDLAGPVAVIGLGETATGLGLGVFEALLRRHTNCPAVYVHTSRYRLSAYHHLSFAELHCHAPDHLVHLPQEPEARQRFLTARTLLLVDDEMSTGNTFVNLAQAYHAANPALERVILVTLTDFSGPAARQSVADRLPVPVDWVSLINGQFRFTANPDWHATPAPSAVGRGDCKQGRAASQFGRCGVTQALSVDAARLQQLTAGRPAGERLLVLGTGEFMHAAFVLGHALEAAGFTVAVQATSRSPILEGLAIRHKRTFRDHYGDAIPHYLYNVEPGTYDRCLICHETPVDAELSAMAAALGAELVGFGELAQGKLSA